MNQISQQLDWNFRTLGETSGTPLLWLHGFLGSGEDWSESVHDHFSQYRNILIDLPGHGECQISEDVQFQEVLDDLLVQMDQNGIQQFIPIGYSMGGRMAYHLYQSAPERILALILLSSVPGLKSDFERKHRLIADGQLMERLEHLGFKKFLDEWYAASLFGKISTNDSLMKKLYETRSSNDIDQLRTNLELMGNGALPSLWDSLGDVRAPTQLITGELDTKYTELNDEISGKIQNCSRETVNGGGHAFHIEKPLETARIIRHFLRKTIEGD